MPVLSCIRFSSILDSNKSSPPDAKMYHKSACNAIIFQSSYDRNFRNHFWIRSLILSAERVCLAAEPSSMAAAICINLGIV